MSARNKKQKQINLLPQEVFAESPVGRVLTWLLSTFRFIVISVEMIVVIAFLSRFWLDSRITDLNDEIKAKTTIINSFQNFEKDFRSAQKRLTAYQSLETRSAKIIDTTDTIYKFLPADTKLVSITADPNENEIRARGIALDEVSIAQYIVALTATGNFESVTLNQANSVEDGNGLDFTLKITLKT